MAPPGAGTRMPAGFVSPGGIPSTLARNFKELNIFREGHVVAAAAVVALPIAAFVPKGMAPLLAVVAPGILIARWFANRTFPRATIRLSMAFAAFVLYSLLTAIWSRTPFATAFAILPLTGVMIGGLAIMASAVTMEDDDRRIAAKGIVVGVAIGLIVLASERFDGGHLLRWAMEAIGRKPTPLHDVPLHFNRGMTVAALLLWPLADAICARSIRLAVFAFVVGAAVVATADALAPVAGPGVGILTAAVAWLAPRATPYAFAAVVAAGVLFVPWIPHALPDPRTETMSIRFLSNSAFHRLYIWRTAADLIQKHPILGYGFDTSRSLYGRDQLVKVALRQDDPERVITIDYEPIPLHPHNMVLQVWLELGAIGALFMLAVLLRIIVAIARSGLERAEKSLCFGFFASALVILIDIPIVPPQ